MKTSVVTIDFLNDIESKNNYHNIRIEAIWRATQHLMKGFVCTESKYYLYSNKIAIIFSMALSDSFVEKVLIKLRL